jgi:hypothetical protein
VVSHIRGTRYSNSSVTLVAEVASREEHATAQVNNDTDQRAMQLMAQGRGSHVVYELSED